MNDIYYAVDMGAPSTVSPGFFCWRYSPKESSVTPYAGVKGWRDCIANLVKDAADSNVHLAVEAALWGLRRTNDKAWLRRFHLKDSIKYTERPWYTGAGASTGLMAQEFFKEIALENPSQKIVVRESYISGLVYEGKRKSVKNLNHS